MNFDLAVMALEGLARAPLSIRTSNEGQVVIEAGAASFKELARLCLLLGSEETEAGEEVELKSPIHATKDSWPLVLRLT